MPTAFDPIELGRVRLANRIVMAPMSRARAYGPDARPHPSATQYYRQRASAGLIVTEGIQPSPGARGYPATPGLHTEDQVRAWREVTDAVHAAGSVIFAQLMHAGRIGHPSLLPAGAVPVGPSAVAANATVFAPDGPVACVTPEVLTEADVAAIVEDFAAAARNAIRAGFDGVELHGANGFLVHQFLSANANLRTDGYGGTVAGRIRFAVEAVAALCDAVGGDRVGLQISPGNPHNDMAETGPEELYGALVDALAGRGLAYLSVTEGDRSLTRQLRRQWPTAFMLNPNTGPRPTGPEDLALVEDGTTDLLSFGTLFLANPDLPQRLAEGGPFNQADRSTFYGGGERGYTDYPFLDSEPVDSAAR
jgi:N-ethylmaleimide reductase